jgi:hypothetical protein
VNTYETQAVHVDTGERVILTYRLRETPSGHKWPELLFVKPNADRVRSCNGLCDERGR